ncbi:MAG: hypothetical protein JWM93_1115 [Frankiales bacterium]|nr:hypothetical protein [Frankiales bacterium]
MTHILRTALPRVGVGAVVALALFVLYAVLVDQGALLQPFVGKVNAMSMFFHEFAHDARHMLGAPCH